MGRNAVVGDQILELFEQEAGRPAKRFNLRQMQDILFHLEDTSVKNALDRLRGMDGGVRKLRVVGYQSQVGHGGKPMPLFELGTEPDVPRTEEFIEDMGAIALAKAKRLRHLQEERRLQKELEAIDNYM